MDNLEQKLDQLKKGNWDTEDKSYIQEMERDLRKMRIDEDFLKLDNTKELVRGLQSAISQINAQLFGCLHIDSRNVDHLNDMISRKWAFVSILLMLKVDVNFDEQKSELEKQIDEGINKLTK
jgi:hypothetical protein